jgi:pimeloyl-ACP methyl ester carboxylesterase
MKFLSRKSALIALLVLAVGGGAAYFLSRPQPPDTRFSGTYRLDDGGLVFVTPSEGAVLRYRRMSGESRALRPTTRGSYEAGPGWAGSEPVEVQLEFEQDASGAPSGFEKGFGEAEIAEADRINAALSAIIDQRENRWSEVERLLEVAEGEAWLEAVKGTDSQVGFVAGTKLPLWVVRLVAWWKTRPREIPAYDRLYDPVPTLASLDVPSLWVFGGRDHSMPTDWTVEALERLRKAGRPIQIRVFPEADHGILVFDEDAAEGRAPRGYAEGYLPLEVEWLRQQSGIGVAALADE